MAIEIEVDPLVGAPPLPATQQLSVESPRGAQIVDRERKVERRQAHGLPLLGTAKIVEAFVKLR
jgi:hypothetical protein